MVFVLVGALVGQGLPLHTMVQYVEKAAAQHECACAQQGVCPENSGGPCACDHSGSLDTTADDASVLPSCRAGQPDKNFVADVSKWIFNGGSAALLDSLPISFGPHFYLTLSPQRLGDEIFRPPRFRTA